MRLIILIPKLLIILSFRVRTRGRIKIDQLQWQLNKRVTFQLEDQTEESPRKEGDNMSIISMSESISSTDSRPGTNIHKDGSKESIKQNR